MKSAVGQVANLQRVVNPPLAAALVCLTGCALGPNYTRPNIPQPPQYRAADPAAGPGSLAETKWADLFQDEALKQLVNTALNQNHDLQIAADRVLEARAQYKITFAGELPSINGTGSFNEQRGSRIGANRFVPPGISLDSSYTAAAFTLNWELDFFGRLRRMTEAAKAQYLATEEGRRGVQTTLIADVMTNYFRLRELDAELEIARQTVGIGERWAAPDDCPSRSRSRHRAGRAAGRGTALYRDFGNRQH